MDNKNRAGFKRFYDLAFAKRPAEELYHVGKDPGQLENLAGNPEFAKCAEESSAPDLQEHLVRYRGPPRPRPGCALGLLPLLRHAPEQKLEGRSETVRSPYRTSFFISHSGALR